MTKPTSDLSPATSIVHLSQVLKSPVIAASGDTIGRVEDLVVRLAGRDSYPPITGVVVGVGGRRVFVPARTVDDLRADRITLSRNKVDLRAFERRDGEVLLRADIMGHRLIDVAAAELVRASDVELDDTGDGWVLARVDTRPRARLFGLIKPAGGHAERDWKSFEPLIGHSQSLTQRRLAGRLRSLKPAELADLLEEADKRERGEILDHVHDDPELEADVFEELESEQASRLLDDRSDAEVAALLGRMRADDAADAVADLRQSRRRRVLDLMPAGQRTKVITLMGFNPDSAGGLMNVDTASCGPDSTAAQALSVIAQARGVQPEALLKVHVLDEGHLLGVVSVILLLQADSATPVRELMDTDPVRVTPDTDLTDIALLMADYNLYAMPVVDDTDRVLGVVTVDDVLEAAIPEDWRRREPAPRPIREPAPGADTAADVSDGSSAP
ncbi:CBS domain-containing protein [Nocardia sp. CA2R105]|uniref:magnesium transporter MgtE N-terminal domain-containing protein n=1 Tax=Nocardia coffeae TaxID=2873381 RepID=UPI001CA60175|nr:CBS domain-containing protein [Nocardia coffeae]MBY8860098.1 CBS domain-containing protein [Nocardia coffeae]